MLWTDYFKAPHFEKYPQLNGLFNEATKLAGAGGTKGSLDVAVADNLLAKIDEIAEIFWETKKAMTRTAVVAGGGIAGLAVATALAQRDWQVQVHERAGELRMFGAGIWMWENGLRSLRVLGAEEQTVRSARRIKQWAVLDDTDEQVFARDFTPDDHMVLPLRADLYQALVAAARTAGVAIATSSPAREALPSGSLVLENGETVEADLVVAADGAFSRIRDGLFLTDRISYLREGYIRLTVPTQPGDEDSVIYECWNGSRRLLYCPCTDDVHYVAFSCAVDDIAARGIPVDHETWIDSFPRFEDIVRRIGDEGRWDRGMTVRCSSWSQGRVVLVGDAAHAMAPNLGQGANMTLTNAVSLAAAVSDSSDVPRALAAWERRERWLTDHVQRWSHGYGTVVSRWPRQLESFRAPFLQAATSFPWVEDQLNRAARHRPAGSS